MNFSDPFGLCYEGPLGVFIRLVTRCRHVKQDRAADEVIGQAISFIKTDTEECRTIRSTAERLHREDRIGLFKDRSEQKNGYTHGGKGGEIDVDVDAISTDPQKMRELARLVAHETVHHLNGAPNEDPAYEAAQRCSP